MKRLALPLLALALVGCSARTTSAPYDASGTWQMEGQSRNETTFHAAGTMRLTQTPDGVLTGTFVSTDRSVNNTVKGSVATGRLTVSGGAELFEITGTFSGNTYTGSYTYGTVDSGVIRMAR